MAKAIQARKYQLTINNPREAHMDHDEIRDALAPMNLDYYALGDEIGAQGTYHTHVFLYRKTPIRFSTIKSKFPTAHIETAYGTCQENVDYIKKQGKWLGSSKSETTVDGTYEEFGTMPLVDETQSKKAALIDAIKSGASNAEVLRMFPEYAFHVRDLDSIRQTVLNDKYRSEYRDLDVTYLWGEPGVGKTSYIYKKYQPEEIFRMTTYYKTHLNFDAYTAQKVVVFEEYHSEIEISALLNLLDRYPMMLPARYNDKVACYTVVFITSNIPLEQQYENLQIEEPQTWNALIRRITRVVHMTKFGIEVTDDMSKWRLEDE
ncbi:MAG: replication protein [Solobacterium sp.]|nr:replication protein [Solobacterium sp.]MCH4049331.1 replication protein [Solobacterium sp.]MCH4075187.1 replication protein [Solobacterium sp.]MCI1313332.1 replication protein [Solobacterium sp.]MCI1345583.1 replication protein [Solobacterium sp.]